MKQFFKFFFASCLGVIFAIGTLFLILFTISVSFSEKSSEGIKKNSVLKLNLSSGVIDRKSVPSSSFDFNIFSVEDKPIGLNELIKSLNYAKEDKNIKGIYIDLNGYSVNWASTEEIRNALIDFKTSGKFIYSYGDNVFEKAYYLGSVSDKVFMNETGMLEFNGLNAIKTFYKRALDKLGVEVQIFKVGKFKSAVEPFINEKMSDASKAQTKALLNSLYNHMLSNVSKSRSIDIELLDSISNNLMVQKVQHALDYKFIDGIIYKDEFYDFLRESLGLDSDEKINFISFSTYIKNNKENAESSTDKIAVVYANGNIMMGKGSDNTIGSENISKAIREARKNKAVKALVLRVNSPGGSGQASDIIWREVLKAKEKMPVIVSMGDVAASGGYYISCLANKIVAQPNTITGSIGVFGMFPNIKELMEDKIGLTHDVVKTGEFSDMFNLNRAVTENERNIIQKNTEDFYELFLKRVFEGRESNREDIHKIAQGRVWTGEQGLKIGLVDTLGGLNTAVQIAASSSNIEKYEIVEYPKRKLKPWQIFIETIEEDLKMWYLKKNIREFI